MNIVDSQIVHNTDCNYPSEQPDVNNDRVNRECCGVVNAWSESGQSDNDDYSVLKVTTIYDNQGKELKKLLNIGLGKANQVIPNIQVASAGPVSFLKQNVSHELKLRDPYLQIYPVDQATKEFYCGFTDNAIKRERYTFILAKSYGGPTKSLGGVERLISTSNNRNRKYQY